MDILKMAALSFAWFSNMVYLAMAIAGIWKSRFLSLTYAVMLATFACDLYCVYAVFCWIAR